MKGVYCKLKKEVSLSGTELNSMFPFLDHRSDKSAILMSTLSEWFVGNKTCKEGK
jgi:hypothetical protein